MSDDEARNSYTRSHGCPVRALMDSDALIVLLMELVMPLRGGKAICGCGRHIWTFAWHHES
jgi:hypothetical protein